LNKAGMDLEEIKIIHSLLPQIELENGKEDIIRSTIDA